MRRFLRLQGNPMEMMVERSSPHLWKWVSTSCTERNRCWKQVRSMSFDIDWGHWRSRVASRGPTYVAKGTTTRGPGQWVPNDECAIDRLSVQSWINAIKQVFKLKGDKAEPLDMYLGASLQRVKTASGEKCWAISSEKYVRAAVINVEERLSKIECRLPSKCDTPMATTYNPAEDV